MERAYTVREIDDLRKVIYMRLTYGTSYIPNGASGTCAKQEDVEAVLRTHMIAGHTAQDLRDEDRNEHPYPSSHND
jgi:hypothetical protein